MDRLESFGQLRDIDLEQGRVTAVISTGDIARDGAIIDPAGWRFENYDRNPIVLWMHDATLMPFARTIDHIPTDSELIARAQFDPDDAFGQRLLAKIAGGYISATSVRWLPLKTEVRKIGEGKEARDVLVFTEQELLEWSFVTVPADPKALILRGDGSPFAVEEYIGEADDARPFANEHSCRLRDPGDFQPNSFRRVNRESGGKRYGVIMGRLKGETSMTEQAYRYPKDVWNVTQARTHCRSHDGKLFEPASEESVLEAQLTGRVAAYVAQRMARPTVDDMVVAGLAKATGKTEERIRREMAG